MLLTKHVWLPCNIRCAAHTLNLLATTDVKSILQANSDYATKYNQAMAKINNVWTACNRSTLASDKCYDTLGILDSIMSLFPLRNLTNTLFYFTDFKLDTWLLRVTLAGTRYLIPYGLH